MWKLLVSNRRNWVVYFQVNHWLEVFSREPGRIKCTVFSWYIIKFLIGYWSTITRHIIVPRVERYVEMNLFCRTAYLHSRIWIRAEFFGCGAIAGTSKWILKNSVGWWLAANNRKSQKNGWWRGFKLPIACFHDMSSTIELSPNCDISIY